MLQIQTNSIGPDGFKSWKERGVLMTHYERKTAPPKSLVIHFTKNATIQTLGASKSGGIYTLEALRKESMIRAKGKEKMVEGKERETREDKATNAKGEKKKEVSNEEATKFLKIVQQSEYKLIDQLNHTSTKISFLSLLINSKRHRKLLVKVLNEAHVAHDITLDKFGGIVGNIIANNYLTFTGKEISSEGKGHNKDLHISVKCMDLVVARVLVDNGSLLNVMPKSTLDQLPCDETHMKPALSS
ncbi:hypothetical protein CR513_05355, partial [Mucuna pruriens]